MTWVVVQSTKHAFGMINGESHLTQSISAYMMYWCYYYGTRYLSPMMAGRPVEMK